ncbi:hypothetical protein F5Y03DRAFT_79489 [Xylaria venustula]|nr:hypothetical protein F5Y03DRAFT_79489 [Xylaria venustula]
MLANNIAQQPRLNSPFIGRDFTQPQVDGQPAGVVVWQGGRDVIAPTGGAVSSNGHQISQRGANGRLPCPHCHKTYLSPKH